MALILYIETSTQVCSVALAENGTLLASRESREKNIHSSIITIFIEEVLRTAGKKFPDLDAVAVSKGPGSYTGLRIGVSTAKGICYALGKPLIAIGTLESMAEGMKIEMTSQSNPRQSKAIAIAPEEMTSLPILYCPMIDARRMEVYSGMFDDSLTPIRGIQAEIITADSFQDLFLDHVIFFAGDGAEKCNEVLGHQFNARFIPGFLPSATYMFRKAEDKFEKKEFEDVAYFEPFYLKDFIPGIPKVKGLGI
jgi:tRNA threonylcarbamoyladenosine biosynthesis protein TsaB